MKNKSYEVIPVQHEDPREIEEQRDTYRAALWAVAIIIVVGGGILWLYKVM